MYSAKTSKKYLLEYPVAPKVEVPFRLIKPMRIGYGQSFGQDFSYNLNGKHIPSFYGQWGLKGHNGIDFPAREGTPIYAPCDLWIDNYNANKTYGDILWAYSRSWEVEGKEYRLEMNFGHLLKKFLSNKGVKRGEQIAISGNSGYPVTSTGAHLHWGVRLQLKVNDIWQGFDSDNGYRGYFNQYLIIQDMFECRRVDKKEIYFIDEVNNYAHHIAEESTYQYGLKVGLWSEFVDYPTIKNYKKGGDWKGSPPYNQ